MRHLTCLAILVAAGCATHKAQLGRSTAMYSARVSVNANLGWGHDPQSRFECDGVPLPGAPWVVRATSPRDLGGATMTILVSQDGSQITISRHGESLAVEAESLAVVR